MKFTNILSIVLFIALIVVMALAVRNALGQPLDEAPEPDAPTFNYEAQIAWGNLADLVWVDVVVVSTQILPQASPGHSYAIKAVGGNRRLFWIGNTPNHTAANPETVTIGIHMPPIPDGKWWGIYRARFRPFPMDDPVAGDGWTEPSRWALVVDLTALPIISPFVAKDGE